MEAPGCSCGPFSEFIGYRNREPSARVDVVKLTRIDSDVAHFLKRHGLGTELDAIGSQALPTRTLRLDGLDFLLSCFLPGFNSIGSTDQTEALGSQPHIGLDPNAIPNPATGSGNGVMEQAALAGVDVLLEDSLHVDEGRLPLAENEMLNAGQRQKVILVHDWLDHWFELHSRRKVFDVDVHIEV